MGDGVSTPFAQRPVCECDWTYHRGRACLNDPMQAKAGSVVSPALCTPCLYVCCAERDDEQRHVHDDAMNRRTPFGKPIGEAGR